MRGWGSPAIPSTHMRMGRLGAVGVANGGATPFLKPTELQVLLGFARKPK